MSTKPERVAAAAVLGAALTVSTACSDSAATLAERGAQQRCFVGDRLCMDDAFDLAKEMLRSNDRDWVRSNDLLLVATGTIEDAHGLPESLDAEREVRATFAIDWLHRYQTERSINWMPRFEKSFARARGAREVRLGQFDLPGEWANPTRFVDEWVRGRMGVGPRKRIAIHLSSNLFVWPESGTSRGVARMDREERERNEETKRRTEALATRLEAGALGREEHRRLLVEDFNDGPVDGGRFVEDRGGALQVGGRYLFALSERVEGDEDAYRFEEAAHYHTTWRVFWGGEMQDVDRAMREIASCLLPLTILPAPPEEQYAWSICEAAARYRGAEREPVVVRQRPIGQQRRRSPLGPGR